MPLPPAAQLIRNSMFDISIMRIGGESVCDVIGAVSARVGIVSVQSAAFIRDWTRTNVTETNTL